MYIVRGADRGGPDRAGTVLPGSAAERLAECTDEPLQRLEAGIEGDLRHWLRRGCEGVRGSLQQQSPLELARRLAHDPLEHSLEVKAAQRRAIGKIGGSEALAL